MSKSFSLQNKKVWVAGHKGMVGRAAVRRLQQENCDILTADLDLRVQADTQNWLAAHKPDAVILAAAKVGGIAANSTYPAEFLYDNLMIESNVIDGAYKAGVEKLLFLGSSCIYPRAAAQPITEDALLTGSLEATNEPYAVAKIAGIKMCQAYQSQYGCNFISAMPCNLYGPDDTYHAENSHVIPALIMKICAAKEARKDHVEIWGTGTPLREFLYVDDLVDALVFLLQSYSEEEHINVGSGAEISIAGLAHMIASITGYKGELVFNADKADGTPRKLMDSGKLAALGWQPQTLLKEGLEKVIADYLQNHEVLNAA